MNKQERILLENVIKEFMLLRDRISQSSTGFPESAVEGMEGVIAKLSQAVQLPQPSEDRVAHRERLVEAIAPIAFTQFLARGGEPSDVADNVAVYVYSAVNTILLLDGKNAANS